jgi:hypothetical protein
MANGFEDILSMPTAKPSTAKKQRSISDWVIIGVIGLVLIQIFGLLLNKFYGTGVYLGPGFLIGGVALAVMMAFGLVMRVMKGQTLEKTDVITLVFIIVVTVFLLLFLRDLVPEIFQPAARTVSIAILGH